MKCVEDKLIVKWIGIYINPIEVKINEAIEIETYQVIGPIINGIKHEMFE